MEEYPKNKYTKCLNSLMESGAKITWPQFLVESIIVNRSKFIAKYKLKKGKKWYEPIQGEVRRLNQQAAHVLSYFEHPEENPVVGIAIIKYLTEKTPLKFGAYRKYKTKATQDEKDFVKGVFYYIRRLEKQKEEQKKVNVEQKLNTPKIIKTDKPQGNKWQKYQN